MSRFTKEQMVKQYRDRFEDVEDLAVIDTQGVDVEHMSSLRSALREQGVQAMVVHNRLCRLALAEVGLERAAELVEGPSTVVWGEASLVDIAKLLMGGADDVPQMEIRGGYLEGKLLGREEIETLSKMPGREELIAMAVGNVLGQAGRVVSLATAPATQILGQVRELENRGEAEAEPAAEPSEEAPAEEAEAPTEEPKADEGAEAPAEEAEPPAEEASKEDS
jgi:large subunit ribosomal protein L10